MVLLMVMAGASCYSPTESSLPLVSLCGIYMSFSNIPRSKETTRQEAGVLPAMQAVDSDRYSYQRWPRIN
jgi:hypothetical protein